MRVDYCDRGKIDDIDCALFVVTFEIMFTSISLFLHSVKEALFCFEHGADTRSEMFPPHLMPEQYLNIPEQIIPPKKLKKKCKKNKIEITLI